MTQSDLNEAREQLVTRVLAARTLPEIEDARRMVREWMAEHPEDASMAFALDRLYRMEESVKAVAQMHQPEPALP